MNFLKLIHFIAFRFAWIIYDNEPWGYLPLCNDSFTAAAWRGVAWYGIACMAWHSICVAVSNAHIYTQQQQRQQKQQSNTSNTRHINLIGSCSSIIVLIIVVIICWQLTNRGSDNDFKMIAFHSRRRCHYRHRRRRSGSHQMHCHRLWVHC